MRSLAPKPCTELGASSSFIVVENGVAKKHLGFDLATLVPALPGAIVALFGIWAVHRLTKSREREKSVFELYRTATDHVSALTTAASLAWTTRSGPERRKAIAETKRRLQQVGAVVERLRMLSGRSKFHWGWWPRIDVTINLRPTMPDLRRALTDDPFEDPTRRADREALVAIELATGDFLAELDRQLFRWMR